MRLGIVIEETWDFFHEVYAHLSTQHQATLYRRPPGQVPILKGRLSGYRLRTDLTRFLERQDAVFFEWASELLAMATHLPKKCGIVARLHRYELYRWAHRVNWDAVDRIILVSDAKRREFVGMFPKHANKVVIIPEAVSIDRFRPHDKTYAGDIGILCHLKPRKRVYELVLAFYELLQDHADFHLHIGGGTASGFEEYEAAVRGLVDRLNLGEKVTFYGHVSKPEEWYPQIDVFISNGYSEGLQVSPMEAMACGCYCLSHQWEGANELLPTSQLFYTNSELKTLLVRYAAATESGKRDAGLRMRSIVSERFNVDSTKLEIQRVVEDAAAAVATA
jgi:glycosyltransferase involved in cell wall biosynthesis